ncbi:MAG: 3'-5' exonuclease [Patescibacteria group bacterium]|jgi:DNA polymerase-3 subunit epsilon|nr:3'-5' exonuclease [Patescibacteria group bacterium]
MYDASKYKPIFDQLKLDKPIIIFDLETTGLIMTMDRIIEIAYIKIFPNGKVVKEDIYLNPEMKISEESMAVHGITDEQVADKPTFKDKAQEFWDIFANSYYGGFNVIGFDLPLLKREFVRVGMDFEYTNDDIVDSKTIFHEMEKRTLSAAYNFYCGKEHVDAHNALADVEVSAEVLIGQIEQYKDILDWEFINKIHNNSNSDRFVDNDRKFYWRDGEAYFSFSKFKDTPLKKVAETETGFLNWIIGADFSEETKDIVKKALSGEFPKKKAVDSHDLS